MLNDFCYRYYNGRSNGLFIYMYAIHNFPLCLHVLAGDMKLDTVKNGVGEAARKQNMHTTHIHVHVHVLRTDKITAHGVKK